MNKSHAENVRIKRDYFAHLKGPGRQSEASIDAVAKALSRFENYTRNKHFKTFRKEQAIGFTAHLSRQINERTGELLSKATLLSTLNALKAFFSWLSQQRGFKSRFTHVDAEYFALSLKDTTIAKTTRGRPVPSIEQIRHVTLSMPSGTDVEKRDRALVALALMTAARDDALASLRLGHVDLDAGKIQQDAREVRTKFSKTFPTYFVEFGDDIRKIFEDWVRYLKDTLLWGSDDPLFPRTRVVHGSDRRYEAKGLERSGWRTSAPIRAIFHKAFEGAGVPYFNPHSFRHAVTRHGQTVCVTLEDHKAFSQNLGHSSSSAPDLLGRSPLRVHDFPDRQAETHPVLQSGRPFLAPSGRQLFPSDRTLDLGRGHADVDKRYETENGPQCREVAIHGANNHTAITFDRAPDFLAIEPADAADLGKDDLFASYPRSARAAARVQRRGGCRRALGSGHQREFPVARRYDETVVALLQINLNSYCFGGTLVSDLPVSVVSSVIVAGRDGDNGEGSVICCSATSSHPLSSQR